MSGSGGTGRPVLEVHGLTVHHGGLVALDDVSVTVGEGEVVGLIGPNGAGKTTLIDAVGGFTAARSGRVTLAGSPLDGAPPHRRARAGLARTFQSLELFDDLTVRENLVVGAAVPSRWSTVTDALWPKRQRTPEVEEVLATFDLLDLADRLPTELSNGVRHRCAVARALVARPRLVLLDEPAAGLDPTETAELGALLARLPALGTSVLLVDHDMDLVLGVCQRVHVLDFGRLVASGTPAQVRADPAVIAAYLGRSA